MAVYRQRREEQREALPEVPANEQKASKQPANSTSAPAAQDNRPSGKKTLTFDMPSVRNGIIMAEILGPPVSKKRRR